MEIVFFVIASIESWCYFFKTKLAPRVLIYCFGSFFPEILRDPEFFYIKSQDNKPRILWIGFSFIFIIRVIREIRSSFCSF